MVAQFAPSGSNTGLHWAYGIEGPAQGHFYTDPKTGITTESTSAYEHPQPHACFIQSVNDNLVGEGGIFDFFLREARLFKYGSGSGANVSNLRGESEPLLGGGQSSGLMSWLKLGDAADGAIKSGGTVHRAAKMVILNADHPDIEKFINWKVEVAAVRRITSGSRGGLRYNALGRTTLSSVLRNSSLAADSAILSEIRSRVSMADGELGEDPVSSLASKYTRIGLVLLRPLLTGEGDRSHSIVVQNRATCERSRFNLECHSVNTLEHCVLWPDTARVVEYLVRRSSRRSQTTPA